MKMRQVDGIQIPAKGEVALKPGSFHIMLFEVRDLSQAVPVPLTLTLDDGQSLTLSLPVKPVEPTKGMQH
jgi:copper(I)-binding protein